MTTPSMKKMLLLIAGLLFGVACNDSNGPPPPVAKVTVNPSPASVLVGGTMQLAAKTEDAAGNVLGGRAIAWASSNLAVATVSATGLVTGVSPGGPVTITATSEGKSGTAAVTVNLVPVKIVTVGPPTPTVGVGEKVQLAATTKDSVGHVLTGRVVVWGSANTATATVDGTGLVTGVGVGTATITATSEGQQGTATITVEAAVAFVEVTPSTTSVLTTATVPLRATTKDSAGNELYNRMVTWATDNTAAATVSVAGLVTGVASGSATITATSEGRSGTAQVTVIVGTVTDLGTLGGPSSEGIGINGTGQVVGRSLTASGYTHPFLWTLAGGMRDLGTLGGDCVSYSCSWIGILPILIGAAAINGTGQVVGSSVTATGETHAFLWTQAGGMQDLGTLLGPHGGGTSAAAAINGAGQVVGVSTTLSGWSHAFLWTQAGGMQDLGTLPGGVRSWASGINSAGEVVGSSVTLSGQERAFLWTQAGGMQDLGTPPGMWCCIDATRVNDAGQVLVNGGLLWFLWTQAAGFQPLVIVPPAGQDYSGVSAISDSGEVVGGSGSGDLGDGVDGPAFRWTPATGTLDLGALPGGFGSGAAAVNDNDQIAGSSEITQGGLHHAVLWTVSGSPPPAPRARGARRSGAP